MFSFSPAQNEIYTDEEPEFPATTPSLDVPIQDEPTDHSPSDDNEDEHPELPTTTSTASVPVDTGFPVLDQNVTTDGMCGSSHNDKVCGDWSHGSCCSPYGVSTYIALDTP